MRGFYKASALLLVPTAVLARPSHVSPVDSSTFVAVKVGTSINPGQTLVFQIDIHESNQACNPAKVRIDGYLLSQDDTGAGQGTFAALDGPIVTASWNFTCMERQGVPWDQEMAMTIMSLDGEAVSETTFSASFSQTAPVMVFQVGGDSRFHTSADENDTLLDGLLSTEELAGFDDELRAEIREMKLLSDRIRGLEDLLEAKELRVLERLGLQLPTSVFDCRDLRCVFRTVAHNAHLAHSNVCDATGDRWKAVLGCPIEKGDDDVEDKHDNGNSRHPHHHHRRPVARLPLLLIVAESAITFGFLFYFILSFIRRRVERRRQGGCSSSSSNSRRFCRVKTWAERRAQRKTRREPIRSFFRSVHGMFRDEHNTKDEKDEKQIMASTSQTTTTTTTTMEQELAGFREAAAMVGDMVAAEEGRRMPEQQQSQPPRHPNFNADDDDDDESLPPYDSETEDAYGPMVTDGPRYTNSEVFKR